MKKKSNLVKGLSEEAYKLIDKEISKYPAAHKKFGVIAALAIAQREHGFVNQDLENGRSLFILKWKRFRFMKFLLFIICLIKRYW